MSYLTCCTEPQNSLRVTQPTETRILFCVFSHRIVESLCKFYYPAINSFRGMVKNVVLPWEHEYFQEELYILYSVRSSVVKNAPSVLISLLSIEKVSYAMLIAHDKLCISCWYLVITAWFMYYLYWRILIRIDLLILKWNAMLPEEMCYLRHRCKMIDILPPLPND